MQWCCVFLLYFIERFCDVLLSVFVVIRLVFWRCNNANPIEFHGVKIQGNTQSRVYILRISISYAPIG